MSEAHRQVPRALVAVPVLLALLATQVVIGDPKASPYRRNVLLPANQESSCVKCHDGIEDMHPEAELSCVDCHGGDPTARSKFQAHVQPQSKATGDESVAPLDDDLAWRRFKNPMDLRVVDRTCSQCHEDMVEHLASSLHGTTAGHLSDGYYEVGLLKEKGSIYSIFENFKPETDASTVDGLVPVPGFRDNLPEDELATHFTDLVRKECMQCHLYSEGRAVRGRVGFDGDYRGEGCAACHVAYSLDGLSESADAKARRTEPGHPRVHAMTSAPTTETCTSCHYGDASIGLAFRGLSQLPPGAPGGPEVPGTTDELLNRQFYLQDAETCPPDVHHERGFLSLVLVDLPPLQQFGTAVGVGSLIAYAVTMTLVPLLLSLLPIGSPAKPKRAFASLFSGERPERLAAWVTANAGRILAVAGVVTVLTLVGVSQVRINADPRTMFPDDNVVMMNMSWIEDRLGGVGDLELVFKAPDPEAVQPLSAEAAERLESLRIRELGSTERLDGFATLSADERSELNELAARELAWQETQIGMSGEFLQQLDRFELRIRDEMADPESPLSFITDLASPLDILRKMHQVQNENAATYYRVPTSGDVDASSREPALRYDEFQQEWWRTPGQDVSSLVSQYYLQYENGARPGENLATQVTPDRRIFRMQGRLRMGSSDEREAAYARIGEIAREEFPALAGGDGALARVSLTGNMMLVDASGRVIAEGYTQSVSIALIVIALFIGLVFRSVRFGILSVIPNVFPVLLPVSLLGAFGVALDGPAIFACSVALGLCVDDTIHLFSKFRDAEDEGLSDRGAVAHAFRECGNALTITTIVLVIGFLLIASGDFSPNIYIGLLGSVMVVMAYVADFLVAPAALVYFTRRTPAPTPILEGSPA